MREVVADVHLQHRAHPGEGVNHDADKRPIAQPHERARVNGREKRPRFVPVEYRRLALFDDVPGPAHCMRRVDLDHLADH